MLFLEAATGIGSLGRRYLWQPSKCQVYNLTLLQIFHLIQPDTRGRVRWHAEVAAWR